MAVSQVRATPLTSGLAGWTVRPALCVRAPEAEPEVEVRVDTKLDGVSFHDRIAFRHHWPRSESVSSGARWTEVLNSMKGVRAKVVLLSLGLLGCGRGLREHDLDQDSFGADTIKLIEDASGIKMPPGAKGLRFHYIPPIDPIYFAKIGLPDTARETIEAQMDRMHSSGTFPDNFANDRCNWWPAGFTNTLKSAKSASGNSCLELYLMKEDGQLILYLKYFTF